MERTRIKYTLEEQNIPSNYKEIAKHKTKINNLRSIVKIYKNTKKGFPF
jgi:hypothetical protein